MAITYCKGTWYDELVPSHVTIYLRMNKQHCTCTYVTVDDETGEKNIVSGSYTKTTHKFYADGIVMHRLWNLPKNEKSIKFLSHICGKHTDRITEKEFLIALGVL